MDHCCSVYLDVVPWKIQYGLRGNDEKGHPKNLGEAELLLYNAYDNFYQAHLWAGMSNDVANSQSLYEHDKRIAEICRHMTIKGVYVDVERQQELSKQIHAKITRLYLEMKELAGRDFSPTKPNDIRQILFEHFGAPVLERTEKQGLPSTGKKTLSEFALKKDRDFGKFAKALTTHRMCKKIVATHVDKLPVEADGRVHPGWKSFATPTGRIGCGGSRRTEDKLKAPNMCNMKRADNRYAGEPEYQIREIFCAAPGNDLIGIDLEQIEPRMAAYLSGCIEFIEAVETGDIHTAIARILFGDLPELKDSKTAKVLGKHLRQVSKCCGLAVNYMSGAETVWETLKNDGVNITFARVCVMLDKLHKRFKSYFTFVEKNLDECRRNGFIVAGFMSGRKRYIGHAPEPQKVANTPIQGGAADIINYRWIEMYDAFAKAYGSKVMFTGQVYDSIIVECPKSMSKRVAAHMAKIMNRPYVINGHTVTLPIEMKIGHRWSDV
jgi:DNA polymerase I-like protein with 3'-5' exonuclease and polymerase domains